MTLNEDRVEAKLEALHVKLEIMHADLKRLSHTSTSLTYNNSPTTTRSNSQTTPNTHMTVQTPTIPMGRNLRFSAVSTAGETTSSPASSVILPTISNNNINGGSGRVVLLDVEGTETSKTMNNCRRKVELARQKMQEFTKSMILSEEEIKKISELNKAPCGWLFSIALACSYISGENITIEDILRYNRLALYYISFPSVTLAELFDVTNEFIMNHTKLNEMKVHCESATFDTETVDELGDSMGMGERLSIMTLSQFRKELTNADGQSIYIINYDPYLIEQHEIKMRLNTLETTEIEAISEKLITPKWTATNQGTFALILSFSPALHSVSIGVPSLLKDGRIILREQTVPVQVLYKALCVKDNYCNRSRGFVRVFINEHFIEKVPSIFPLNILDGTSTGGLLTSALDTSIAPHILGLSLMHHIVTCTILDKMAQIRQCTGGPSDIKLRGIPLTKVCQKLGLGIATIVSSSNKSSVPAVYSWYRTFLKKLNIENSVALGAILISRRGGAEDGPVNIGTDTFMHHIEIVLDTLSVMLIGFDVNIALNVKVDNRPEPCHFAIIIGLDKERGIVRLADVNVKKYRKTWHVPLTRLHSAVIGYGYIVAANSQRTIDKLDCGNFEKIILSEARYSLPPVQRMLRFEYPKKNYVVTVLADAFDRLGFNTDVESVVNLSGFHLSFMLSEHLPLENTATVARNFSSNYAYNGVSVTTTHMDEGATHSTKQAFLNQIRHAVKAQKNTCLIVNFQASIIHANKSVWNGSNGGSYAIVLNYDEGNSLVTLSDANHESFYRIWVCPDEVLFNAVCAVDPIALRARGTLLLSAVSQHDMFSGCFGYDMSHSLVHHPFKPSVWPACNCLALVASEMCGKSLTSDRSVQYSAEDFLYSAPSFSVYKVLMGGLEEERFIAFANNAFESLQLPLEAEIVDINTVGSFIQACCDEVVNGKPITMTLIGYDTRIIHGIAGFSVGVINRVRINEARSSVQIVEGNGCTFGAIWERPATELQPAIKALVRIRQGMKKG